MDEIPVNWRINYIKIFNGLDGKKIQENNKKSLKRKNIESKEIVPKDEITNPNHKVNRNKKKI